MTRFYCEVLGCSVEKEQADLGLTQLRAGRSLIDLLKVGGKLDHPENGVPGAGRNMDHVCLRVDPFDAEALKAHLAEHSARPGEPGFALWRGRIWAVAVSVRPGRQYGRAQRAARSGACDVAVMAWPGFSR